MDRFLIKGGQKRSGPQLPPSGPPQLPLSGFQLFMQRREPTCPTDLGAENPSQPKLLNYPKTKIGNRERSFSSRWYDGHPWLEYSVSADKAFCFPCRKFTKEGEGDVTFVVSGFCNWKTALESKKGFSRHCTSKTHILAMSQWEERKALSERGKEIHTVLEPEQITRNRHYVKSIAETIQFLAVNELSFRGSEGHGSISEKAEQEKTSFDGLFMALFLYTINKDKKLQAIIPSIPTYASYTSPEIQNEVISILGSMVVEQIASLYRTSEVDFFCIKADETRDASGTEHLSVVVRFVKDGKPAEHLLGLYELSQLTADYISDLLLKVLPNCGFNPKQLLAQYYDGASVMSGRSGGVQKKIQEKLDKTVLPYIHCYNHQLHLVIVSACSKILTVKQFFDTCNSLYNFTKKHRVNRLYSGSRLKRLLEHRWTGHLATARAISDNFREVLLVLHDLADPEGEAAACTELRLEATGLYATCANLRFAFLALLMKEVLSIFEPVNAALQDKDMHLGKAAEVVNTCISVLKDRRSKADILFEELMGKTAAICEENKIPVDTVERGVKRKRKDKHFQDFIVEGSARTSRNMSSPMYLKQVFVEVHDYSISEAETRFSSRNVEYLSALDSLIPNSDTFLEVEAVKPVLQLLHVNEDNFAAEADLIKRSIALTNPQLKKENSIHNALAVLFSYKGAFPNVYKVLAAAVTFGASTATCESPFSCLTRVLQPQRLTMSHLQKNSLVLLGYEKLLTNQINIDIFLEKFRSQSRWLLL